MWEYKSDWLTYKSHPELIEKLNELGKDGWELVYYWAGDATALNEEHAFVIMKRKISRK